MKLQVLVKRKRRIRVGKGFSRGELREVNLSVKEALRLGIPVDVRRSTKHDENVEVLKSYLAEVLPAKKSPRTSKRVSKRDVKSQSKGKPTKIATDLTQVPGIGPKRAQQLKNAGINSIEELAKADPKEISKNLQLTEAAVSKWIADAKRVLQSQKD